MCVFGFVSIYYARRSTPYGIFLTHQPGLHKPYLFFLLLFSAASKTRSYRHIEEDDQPETLDTANDDGEQVCACCGRCVSVRSMLSLSPLY